MSNKVHEYLNQLLADTYQLLSLTRQVHWYMRGERFSVLHPMLDDYIDEYNEDIDEVAEMLIILGGSPYSTLDELSANSQLEITVGDYDLSMNEQLAKLIEGLEYFDDLLGRGIDVADKANNQPMLDMLTGMQASTEKHLWMLNAELGKASIVAQK